MRSTILDGSNQDRAKFDRLLRDADVFFSNRRPGYLERDGLTAEELIQKRPGLIHAKVVLHGERGPWSNWVGFDEIGAAVSGVFANEGTPAQPQQPAIVPICDNVVGWLGTVGVLEALRRRATEGGSYRVVVSRPGPCSGCSRWESSTRSTRKRLLAPRTSTGWSLLISSVPRLRWAPIRVSPIK